MVEFNVYTIEGKKEAEKLTGSDAVFKAEVNKGLLHQAVLYYLARGRAGTHSTLTKGEVRGGGKKPFNQKHTGNARMGSMRSPLNPGGGVAFGPKPRSYEFSMNKKTKMVALRSALTSKVADISILKDTELKEPKTKLVQKFLDAVKIEKNSLIIDEKLTDKFVKASRNVANLKAIAVKDITVYELLKYNNIFLTKSAVKKLEEKLA